jgi:hypothetical protein
MYEEYCAGILKQSLGPRNRVVIGLSYRAASAGISKRSMGEGQEPSRNKVVVLARQAT